MLRTLDVLQTIHQEFKTFPQEFHSEEESADTCFFEKTYITVNKTTGEVKLLKPTLLGS